jgi:hypothetical protein
MNSRFTLIVLAALAYSSLSAIAEEPKYHPAYDMTSEFTMNGKLKHIHSMCDGKGHRRSEVEENGKITSISISDKPNGYSLSAFKMDGKDVYMKNKDTLPDYIPMSERYKDYTPLGPKVVNGYKCHGFEKKFPSSGQTEIDWVCDDNEVVVLNEGHGDQESKSVLTSFSDKAPTFSMELPPGYTLHK